jgi:hypothetical protein
MPVDKGISVLGAYSIDKAPEAWTRDDFYILGKRVDTEEAFIAHAIDLGRHQIEQARLGRTPVTYNGHTPWGPAQSSQRYGDGIVFIPRPVTAASISTKPHAPGFIPAGR